MAYTIRRQQLAEWSIENYGMEKLYVAAMNLMAIDRGIKLPKDDETPLSFTHNEIIAFMGTLDEDGIVRLCKVADEIGDPEEFSQH